MCDWMDEQMNQTKPNWCLMAECNCWVNNWILCIWIGWNDIHIVVQNVTAECIIGYIVLGYLFFKWLQFNTIKFEFVMTQFRTVQEYTYIINTCLSSAKASFQIKKSSHFIANKKISAVLCKSCDLHNQIKWNYNFVHCM